jgi:hypothetical protein
MTRYKTSDTNDEAAVNLILVKMPTLPLPSQWVEKHHGSKDSTQHTAPAQPLACAFIAEEVRRIVSVCTKKLQKIADKTCVSILNKKL